MKSLFILYGFLSFCNSYRLRTLCKNCIHFIPSLYGAGFELQEYYGKCGKYITVKNGVFEYEYAYKLRQLEDKCGENATEFVQRNMSLPLNSIEID
jgi:hypothetical protein